MELRPVFVYGTLLSGFANPMRLRMKGRVALMAEGSVPGRLYDLGPYPALTPAFSQGESVRGELYRLTDPAVLAELDEYEDARPHGARGGLYYRAETDVTLDDGSVIPAWVYVYDRGMDQAHRIESGDYKKYIAATGKPVNREAYW